MLIASSWVLAELVASLLGLLNYSMRRGEVAEWKVPIERVWLLSFQLALHRPFSVEVAQQRGLVWIGRDELADWYLVEYVVWGVTAATLYGST